MSDTESRLFLRRTVFITTVPTLICALLYCLLLVPLYISASNDVIYSNTMLPSVIRIVYQLMEMMLLFLCCTASACACYMFDSDRRARIPVFLTGISVILFKHLLNLAVSVIGSGWEDPVYEIFTTLIYSLLDILVLGATYFTARGLSRAHYTRSGELLRARKYIDGFEYNERDEVYPPKNVLPARHVILFPVFIASLIYTLLAVLSRVYYDIIYGAPTDLTEALTIIFAYLGDIVLGAVAYFFSFLIFVLLFRRKKQKADGN